MIGLYCGNCKLKIFFAVYQYLILTLLVCCKFSSITCSWPTFHLYRTNTELAHCEAILKKLNKIWIQKNSHTKIIRIQGIILGPSSSPFCNILSHIRARVIIVQDIRTVPYHIIADQIIHRIHHQIKVVKAIEVRILSFFIIAYGNAISNNTYTIIQKKPISV